MGSGAVRALAQGNRLRKNLRMQREASEREGLREALGDWML
jgi:hypothetical protein